MLTVAVIDYDMGNLHSVCKGLEKAGVIPQITDSPAELERANAVVLPGVGSFDPAVQHLRSRNLEEPIKQIIASGKPFLGICLGLQILFESSEEGTEPGLGIFRGVVRRFKPEPGLTIPHMGWNQLQLTQPQHPLWNKIGENPWMYFVHSYYVDPADPLLRAATVPHGTQTVTAAVARDNLIAMQFHPEKSHSTGLQILSNFAAWVANESFALKAG